MPPPDAPAQVRPPAPYLNVNGRRVYPEPVEAALRAFPGVLDAAVCAIGGSRERRVVAYLVLRPGLDRVDIEGPLEAFLRDRGLKVWQRPRAYAQVKAVPRCPETGEIRRPNLEDSFEDGKRMYFKKVRWPAGQRERVTATLATPINEVRFEGVISVPPKRADRAIQLTVSHREPGHRAKYVTFTVTPGTDLAKRAVALTTGEHVVLVGTMGARRAVKAVDLVVLGGESGVDLSADPAALVGKALGGTRG